MAEYIRCYCCKGTIRAVCEDYRAAAGIDLDMDRADDKAGHVAGLVQGLHEHRMPSIDAVAAADPAFELVGAALAARMIEVRMDGVLVVVVQSVGPVGEVSTEKVTEASIGEPQRAGEIVDDPHHLRQVVEQVGWHGADAGATPLHR